MMTLSVVMPNHNHARYLPESLGAIVAQSFAPLEVIVVDDASTDGSVAIIEDFARRHPSIRLLRNERNVGPVESARRAVAGSRGDYLFFPAADDRILPGLFEKSMSLLARHPEAAMSSTLCGLIGPAGEDLGPCRTPVVLDAPGYLSPEQARAAFEERGSWTLSFGAVYRRAAYLELGGHDPELGANSDGLLNFALPLRYGSCFIPEVLALWRKSDQGFALKTVSDWRAGLSSIERSERRMRAPDIAKLFSEKWLARWKRQALLALMYELWLRGATPEPLTTLAGLMPAPSARDRLYLAAMRARPSASRLLTKTYILSHQPLGDLSRLARDRARRLLGTA